MADIGHNLTGLKKKIADGIQKMGRLKNERADVNAEMAAIREALQAEGIPKKAFAMALQYLNMDPDDRVGFDIAYALCREAGGLPLQEDLFQAADRMAAEAEEAKQPEERTADASAIDKVFRSEDTAKTKGKTVHEPTGQHQGTIN